MLLVIFGAGASYDSATYARDAPDTSRPPLAKDLVARRYDDIASSIPWSRPVIDRLRELSPGTAEPQPLETALAQLNEEAGASDARRQQLVAFRFYLYDVIHQTTAEWLKLTGGFTNYLRLMNRLYDWQVRTGTPVRIATFNYDVMVEEAISDILNWTFEALHRYIERSDFRLFKLHGSTTWSRVIATNLTHGVSAQAAAMELAAAGQLAPGEIMARGIEGQVVPARRSPQTEPNEFTIPALAVPTTSKAEFECPADHVALLRSDLPEVTHVLIIGWRGAEPHAVELLLDSDESKGLTRGWSLGIVDWTDDGVAQVKRNLEPVTGRGLLRFEAGRGFSDFVDNMRDTLDAFLAARPGE
jgi:hypothetical protein